MKQPAGNKTLNFFELYTRFIQQSKTGRRLQPNGKKITAGTLANYGYTQNLLVKFCAAKKLSVAYNTGKIP